jgi:hypothetical protein
VDESEGEAVWLVSLPLVGECVVWEDVSEVLVVDHVDVYGAALSVRCALPSG